MEFNELRESLIDALWMRASECDYLSDLRMPMMRGAVRRALTKLKADDFPMADWNEAVSYITDSEDESFGSQCEAWRYLYDFCGRESCFKGA